MRKSMRGFNHRTSDSLHMAQKAFDSSCCHRPPRPPWRDVRALTVAVNKAGRADGLTTCRVLFWMAHTL